MHARNEPWQPELALECRRLPKGFRPPPFDFLINPLAASASFQLVRYALDSPWSYRIKRSACAAWARPDLLASSVIIRQSPSASATLQSSGNIWVSGPIDVAGQCLRRALAGATQIVKEQSSNLSGSHPPDRQRIPRAPPKPDWSAIAFTHPPTKPIPLKLNRLRTPLGPVSLTSHSKLHSGDRTMSLFGTTKEKCAARRARVPQGTATCPVPWERTTPYLRETKTFMLNLHTVRSASKAVAPYRAGPDNRPSAGGERTDHDPASRRMTPYLLQIKPLAPAHPKTVANPTLARHPRLRFSNFLQPSWHFTHLLTIHSSYHPHTC